MGSDQQERALETIPPWASSRAIWRQRLGLLEQELLPKGEPPLPRRRSTHKTFAARQKQARHLEENGFTQREIAEHLGCSVSQVCRMLKPFRVDRRCVYFIQAVDGGLIKIGVAQDPESRLLEFQVGCPVELRIVALTEGGRELEKRLHQRFQGYRKHGEWFEPCEELLSLIAAIEEMEERYAACPGDLNEASRRTRRDQPHLVS